MKTTHSTLRLAIALLTVPALSRAGAETISLETAPPVVVRTEPTAGATNVDPSLAALRVTFSKRMEDGSWSWSTWGEENFPEIAGQIHYKPDERTCVLPVKLQPGKFYATWLNSAKFRNFRDQDGRAAVPYLLTFTTGSEPPSTSQSPAWEDLPGELIFRGRYRHHSRGRAIDTPSELWLKAGESGTVVALAEMPWMGTREEAHGDPERGLTRYRVSGAASGDRPEHLIDLKLGEGEALLTRRGIREEQQAKALAVPRAAWFDPNTRPDPYCAANILLRAFNLRPGETREHRMYDWDNSGEGLADYTVEVSHAGRERVEVPAGAFEANHLVWKQLTTANTWFKKRAGHVTDFWVLDNGLIVRVLRHREPYEMVLLDYQVPESLDASASYVGVHPFGSKGGMAPTECAPSGSGVPERSLELLLNDDQKAVIAWTDGQFRGYFDNRTFDDRSREERETLETQCLRSLSGPRSREYYTAINTLGALASTNALPRLRELAFERVDKNNRDRWMAVRVLGILDDRQSVPDLIHLVYHGNPNTRWWAQIVLVRLTGQNFGGNWEAWGDWWNASGGQPPYEPRIIRWWDGQAETAEALRETLRNGDRSFLDDIR